MQGGVGFAQVQAGVFPIKAESCPSEGNDFAPYAEQHDQKTHQSHVVSSKASHREPPWNRSPACDADRGRSLLRRWTSAGLPLLGHRDPTGFQ